ncbi:MAG: zinc ribbon domain-containing protein [Gemmataceae bacterium]|nr:zinc ribbon domain-containing protein [Gemmataceae bacterium]
MSALFPCPGCDKPIHPSARSCPQCGYQPDRAHLDDLWAGLVGVSSILAGFGLAALVQLVSGESRKSDEPSYHVSVGLLVGSSLLLLAVIVGAELLRRQEPAQGAMRPNPKREERARAVTGWLLLAFCLGLASAAASVVLLGFFFHLAHGIVGSVVAALAVFLLSRCL